MGKCWWLICIFILTISSCSANNETSTRDSLRNGEKLYQNQILISKGGYFQLSFYTMESDNSQYLMITFMKASSYPIVWVANRDNPFFTTASILTFEQNGNLVIIDEHEKSNSLLITNVSLLDNKNVRIVLLDSGNLVLQDNDSTILWQSFDFPTDTILPGMKIGYSKTSGKTWSYTSWKNWMYPTSGKFTAVVDPNQSGWAFIVKRNVVKYLSWVGLSNSTHVYSIRSRKAYFSTHVDLQNNNFYSVFDVDDKDFLVAFVLQSVGSFEVYYWFKDDPDWTKLMQLPNRVCDYYGYCGHNTVCNSNSSNLCSCFQGFHPNDPENWSKQIYSKGCQRNTTLRCTKIDQNRLKFIELSNVTMPSNPIFLPGVHKGALCESACRANCSCNAYLFSYIENRCWIVSQDLYNVQKINSIDVPGGNLHIKVSASASDLFTTNNGMFLCLLSLLVITF